MNKIGIHYGSFVSNWMDEQLSLIKKVKELGFDMLEMSSDYLLSLDDEELERLRNEASERGVDLTISLGLTLEQDIASTDPAIRNNGIKLLCRIAAVMNKAGIPDCGGIVFCAWNGKISSFKEKEDRWKYSVGSMREVVKAFEANGV